MSGLIGIFSEVDRSTTIAVALAAISAAAAAVSAIATRQSVERAHRPFVWPAISHSSDGGTQVLRIRLHNDGAGAAYDVRWSFGSIVETSPGSYDEDRDGARQEASLSVRAIRPGESVPPEVGGWLEKTVSLPPDDVGWILVRWSDAAGTRWEVSDQGPAVLRMPPAKLRRWRWQVWRDKRDW